jgi:hypothetical protein
VAAINSRRVWLGALVGGIVFFVWSMITELGLSAVIVGQARRDIAGMNQWFLQTPRVPVPVFFVVWIVSLFLIAYGLSWLYAHLRATAGAGPATAAKVGLAVGFAAGFPLEFAHSVFQPLSARYGIMWMVEMIVGCILAALAAGWMYREPAQA